MKRIYHKDLIPNTDEWHQFRAIHDGASEAAIALGLHKNVTRLELLNIKATGIAKEFSAFVEERVFSRGHVVEDNARPIAAGIIGEALSTGVFSLGNLSYSADGVTVDQDTLWEHKQYNAELFAAVKAGELPEHLMPQCQQGLMITGASMLLFTVSDGTEENEAHMWIYPDEVWFDRIRKGWAQFNEDLANHVPEAKELKPIVVAREIDNLPVLRVEVTGRVTTSNLIEFEAAAVSVITTIQTDLVKLVTDQDYADATAASKYLKAVEENAKRTKQGTIDQTESIAELHRTLDRIIKLSGDVRKSLDKQIVDDKANRKLEIVTAAKGEIDEHLRELNNRIGGFMPSMVNDFGAVIKGLSSIDSMKAKVNAAIANAKIEASNTADRIEMNIRSLDVEDQSWRFLFPDLGNVCNKAADDFGALLAARVANHKAIEEKREADQRERIRQEELDRIAKESVAPPVVEPIAQVVAAPVARPAPISSTPIRTSAPAPKAPVASIVQAAPNPCVFVDKFDHITDLLASMDDSEIDEALVAVQAIIDRRPVEAVA